jgi:hypothetical protein
LGAIIKEPYNNRLTASIEIEIAYDLTQRTLRPEATKGTLKIGVTVDYERFVDRATSSTPKKCCDRRGNTANRAYTTGNFLNIYAGIGMRRDNRHRLTSFLH